jgi:uncharacterized cupin superfamily protein
MADDRKADNNRTAEQESDGGHLIRAQPGRSRDLGKATGMKRLGVEEVHLEPGDAVAVTSVESGPERFVFVVRGRGTLTSPEGSVVVAAGDFVGAKDPLEVSNPNDEVLVILCGGENS